MSGFSGAGICIPFSDVFHVHTFRCGHAEKVSDEAYIQRALDLNATGIWFTDHAPFPGDPFGNRMRYAQLDKYIRTLTTYRKKYAGRIAVHIGLEVEYFPSYRAYYEELRGNPDIEILLLGQHMAEDGAGQYTFSWSKEQLFLDEYRALGDAIVQGVRTGYFDVVAHPDRIFRRRKIWDERMGDVAEAIVGAASSHGMPLEKNLSSMKEAYLYWPQFWDLVPDSAACVVGCDAHTVDEVGMDVRK